MLVRVKKEKKGKEKEKEIDPFVVQ